MLNSWSFGRRFAGRIARVVSVAVATIAYLLTPIGGGGGAAHAADQTLTVSTATGNQLVLGQPIQITIGAKSDTLISGSIVVEGDNSAPTEYKIEVPAGTTKELIVAGLPLSYPQQGYSITWYDNDRKLVARTVLRSALEPGDIVAGVFPSLGTDFPERISQPTETDAHLFTIPDRQLELPALAFAQYDIVLATMADLQRLADDQLSSLENWLATGGRLVLDDGNEAAVGQLLDAADFDGAYGDGQVLFTDGTLRSGGWEAATTPIKARSVMNLGPIGWMNGGGFGFEPPTRGLVKYSGKPLIGTGSLLLFGALYALIVGPVMFIAFRRRRRALWVVGPLIAAITCGVIWLDSARRRDSIKNAHGTVVQVRDVASEASSTEMMYVRSDDPVTLTLPPSYTLGSLFDNYEAKTVALSREGMTVGEEAEVGSFVLYNGNGPARQFNRQVTGTVTIEGDSASGEVTNHLDVDLHQVGVLWDGKAKNIGDIPAGETVKYTIGKPDRVSDMAAFQVWGDAFRELDWFGPDSIRPSRQPRPDLVSPTMVDMVWISDPTVGATQDVDIIGWTDALDSPVTGSAHGVSAVATKLHAERTAGEGETDFVYATEAMNNMNWSAEALLRFDAPEGATDPVLRLSRAWQSPELLIDGKWVPIKPDSTASFAIPRSMLDGQGGIYLKAELNLEQLASGPSFDLPVLHEAKPDEKTVSLGEIIAPDEGTKPDDTNPDQPDPEQPVDEPVAEPLEG